MNVEDARTERGSDFGTAAAGNDMERARKKGESLNKSTVTPMIVIKL